MRSRYDNICNRQKLNCWYYNYITNNRTLYRYYNHNTNVIILKTDIVGIFHTNVLQQKLNIFFLNDQILKQIKHSKTSQNATLPLQLLHCGSSSLVFVHKNQPMHTNFPVFQFSATPNSLLLVRLFVVVVAASFGGSQFSQVSCFYRHCYSIQFLNMP